MVVVAFPQIYLFLRSHFVLLVIRPSLTAPLQQPLGDGPELAHDSFYSEDRASGACVSLVLGVQEATFLLDAERHRKLGFFFPAYPASKCIAWLRYVDDIAATGKDCSILWDHLRERFSFQKEDLITKFTGMNIVRHNSGTKRQIQICTYLILMIN